MCLWQIIISIFDTSLGFIYYRSHLLPSTIAYHIVKVYILSKILTWNCIFFTMKPSSTYFAIISIEEIPMIFLYVGYVVSSVKYDSVFGALYFMISIFYHAFVLLHAAHARCQVVLLLVLSIDFVIHLNIFNIWLTKSVRRIVNATTNGNKKKSA